MLDIDNLYKYKVCCYIFAILHKQKHSNTTFTENNLNLHYTRQNNNLYLINVKSNFGKRSVFFKGITTYNSLPEKIKSLTNFFSFRNKLKAFLLNKQV